MTPKITKSSIKIHFPKVNVYTPLLSMKGLMGFRIFLQHSVEGRKQNYQKYLCLYLTIIKVSSGYMLWFCFFRSVCVCVDLKVGYCPNTAFSFTFLFIIIFTSSHIWNKESTTWLNYNEIEMLFLCQRAFTSWLPNQKGKTSFFFVRLCQTHERR